MKPTTKNGGAQPISNSIGNRIFPIRIPILAVAITKDNVNALKQN